MTHLDPFPPAKSDEEIAALLDQMGAELGVFDPRSQKVTRPVIRARRRSAPRSHRTRSAPTRIDTAVRRRPVPPPVPDWALDRTNTRPTPALRAG